MTKKELKAKKIEELKVMALELGVSEEVVNKTKKDDLVNMISVAEAGKAKPPKNNMEFGSDEQSTLDSKTLQDIDDILNMADNTDKKGKTEGDAIKEVAGTSTAVIEEKKSQGKQPEQPPVDDDIVDLSSVPTDMFPIHTLKASKMNFFKPLSEKKFKELSESIKSNGLLTPIIIRPQGDGYEILAGHNRVEAFKKLGKSNIPARLVHVSDEKAREIIIDTNVAQRQELTPMEIAKAYDEKKRILGNRQGQRNDIQGKEMAGATRDILGQEYGVSGMTVDRYLRLMNLIDEFQWMIDKDDLPAKTGMELGQLPKDVQRQILKSMKVIKDISTGKAIKVKKLIKDKEKLANGAPVVVNDAEILAIIQEQGGAVNTGSSDVAFTLKLDIPVTVEKEYADWIKETFEETPEWIIDLLLGYKKGTVVFTD